MKKKDGDSPSDKAEAKNLDLKSVCENESNLLGVWPYSAKLLCVCVFASSCFFAPLLFVESAVVEEGPWELQKYEGLFRLDLLSAIYNLLLMFLCFGVYLFSKL